MATKKQTTKQTGKRQPAKKAAEKTTVKRSDAIATMEKQQARMHSIALFAVGLLFLVMLFVPGAYAWAAVRTFFFGVFGVSFYFLGVALLYLAVLLAQQEPWLAKACKILLSMTTLSGIAILFSKFEMTGLTAGEIVKAYYQNGAQGLFGGGLMGGIFGGALLALCGRPAANILVLILFICVIMLLTGITPAEIAIFISAYVARAKEQGDKARDSFLEGQAQRSQAREEQAAELAARQAQSRIAAQTQSAQAEDLVGDSYPFMPQQAGETPQQEATAEGEQPWFKLFGRQIETIGNEGDAQLQVPEQAPVSQPKAEEPRAFFDIDLGPNPSQIQQGTSEPIEPIVIGPGGTFGLEAVRGVASVPMAEVTPTAQPEPTEEVGADGFWQTPIEEQGSVVAASAPAATTVVAATGVASAIMSENTATTAGVTAAPSMATPVQSIPATPTTPVAKEGWISMSDMPEENPTDIAQLAAVAMDKPKMADQALAGAPAAQVEVVPTYQYPSIELFDFTVEHPDHSAEAELKANAQKLVETLDSFGVKTRVLDISRGPSVTRYELQPLAGVKISRITNLADDIALNLSVAGVRMEAPIPGKPAVGIEVPNRKSTGVSMRGVLESKNYTHMESPLTFALGKDIAGVAQVADLCKMPHLLVAGSTGSGKSVCINSIIMSFLFRSSPEDVKLILIDPKVVELAEYNGIPHLLMPVVTEPRKAAGALGSAVAEMEKRYRLFADNNVRDIKTYNKLAADMDGMEKLPYIAIVIDELADLMMTAGKEVEDYICRIAQKARAAGMHLIVATQRPSVDVITGLIKTNIPSRISFAVSSQIDSRTILDAGGAEKLLGMGDMLFMPVGSSKPTRIQGAYVKDEEISRVLSFLKKGGPSQYDETMIAEMEKVAANQKGAAGAAGGATKADDDAGDPMLKQCAEVVIEAGQASTSLLQRRCKLGYARAARIMDEMEQLRIIGPYEGAKPRAVLVSRQQWIEMCMNESDATDEA